MILLFSSIAFPPFYSVNLESRGTIDSPVLLSMYQSLLCAHHPEGRAFPCFSFFLPFNIVSLKAMVDFCIPECAWCHVPYDSPFGRPSFLSFSWVSGIQLCWFESSLLLLPFFIAPCSSSSRYRSFCIVSGYSRSFSLLLARFLISKKDVFVLCF